MKIKKLATALILIALVLSVGMALRWEQASDGIVLWDDLRHVNLAFTGECRIHQISFPLYAILCNAGQAESVPLLFFLFLLVLGLSAFVSYQIVEKAVGEWKVAFLAGAAFFISPLVDSQVTFLTGSHPSFGLLFALLAYWALADLFLDQNSALPLPNTIAAGLLFLLAGYSSPSFVLASLSVLPLAVVDLLQRRRLTQADLALWGTAGLPTVWFLLKQFSGSGNAYNKVEGWVNVDLDSIAREVREGLQGWGMEYSVPVGTVLLAIFFFATCNAVYSSLRRSLVPASEDATASDESSTSRIILTFSAAALLTAIPGFLTIQTAPRYLVASSYFVVSVVGIFVFTPGFRTFLKHNYQNNAFIAIVVVFLVAFSHFSYRENYGLVIDGQRTVKAAAEAALLESPDIRQFLVVTESDVASTTQGNNHWSTHFLRMATGRQDVYGLVGAESRMRDEPFFDRYRDHGPEYWGTRGGIAYRKKMVGLLRELPTTVLRVSKDDVQRVDCIEVRGGNEPGVYRTNEKGIELATTREEESMASTLKQFANCATYKLPFSLAQQPEFSPTAAEFHSYDGTAFDRFLSKDLVGAEAFESVSFAFSSGPVVDQDFTLGDRTPPMPFVSDALAIYQRSPDTYRLSVRCKIPETVDIQVAPDQWVLVEMQSGEGGIFQLKLNGVHVLTAQDCPGIPQFSLGKGFKERFWQGRISTPTFR